MSDLLQITRAAAPDYRWEMAHHSNDRVTAHIGDGRWLHVESQKPMGAPEADRSTFVVCVSRLQRETPTGDGNNTERLYTERCHRGPDLAALVAQAVADQLEARIVAGVVLWPTDRPWNQATHWIDDSGRIEFKEYRDGTCGWKCTSDIARQVASLIDSSYGFGGQADSLPQAVADAMDAPRRIAALLSVLNTELLRPVSIDPWTYAGVVRAKDGETAFAGPCDTMLGLKAEMAPVEKPFIGRMDVDNSFIVAVPDHLAGGLDAKSLIAHPAALRLKRY